MPYSNRKFKDAIYEQFGRIGKALASPKRLEMMDLLCQGPKTVETLSRQADQTLANTSQHLQVLRAARLVESEKNGLYVTYRLADDNVCRFYQALRALAESRLFEIAAITREFMEQRDSLELVKSDELALRMHRGEVTLLDVRPTDEFESGHIPGAISVPLAELESRLAELPRDQQIVAYCRGPYCVLSVEAISVLRKKGFRAVRMEDGVSDWKAAGLPVDIAE
ncbi:MAG: ArsR family transcriptional regulator [Deltaproteobacteria bacterium]|nr:ArsR family transcriptional regulator [Deltaproteobacteria bacterium]MBN2670774.1 ArsR family transcriptional regulator [Deltaproteobacteria bacterium]